jgi:5-methylcytosine-specific restriction endonuclease McrA
MTSRLRSKVFQKFQGRCQFKAPGTPKKCDSKTGIEVDHIYPRSKGGTNEVSNLTLLCSAHNKFKSNAV